MNQAQSITSLTAEQRSKISEGLLLFVETELNAALEGSPNADSAGHLYRLDSVMRIAEQRRYISKKDIERYQAKRDKMMDRVSWAED